MLNTRATRLLGLTTLLAALAAWQPALTQDNPPDPFGFYLAKNQAEMLDALFAVINGLNAEMDMNLIEVQGDIWAESLLDSETEIKSPYPELSDGVFAFRYKPNSLEVPLLWSALLGNAPSGTNAALFNVDNAVVFVDAILSLGKGGGGEPLTSSLMRNGPLPTARPNKIADESNYGFIFEGFDHLFSGNNSVIVINGVSAECTEECFDLENSRVLLINSSLDCEDDCVRLEDAGAGPTELDFEQLNELMQVGDLSPAESAKIAAAFAQYQAWLEHRDVVVHGSTLVSTGGAVTVTRSDFGAPSARVLIDDAYAGTSSSGERAVNLQTASSDNLIHNSVVDAGNSRTDALDFTYGELSIQNSWVRAGEQGIKLSDGRLQLGHTTISLHADEPQQACDKTFNSDMFVSAGYNVIQDDSCAFGGTGDQETTDSGLALSGGSSVPAVGPNAAELDGGQAIVSANELPCSLTDMTGLPRPQDGDGNGSAECDVGPAEQQRGGNIGAPQTGAYYALERDGEGIFVEMLQNGQGLVYLFSYAPDGSPFWAQGVGEVDRNGIIIPAEAFITTSGPRFGPDYDPNDINVMPFANFAVSLPGCDGESSAGMMAIEANETLGFAPLLGRTTSLTSIMDCDGGLKGPPFTGSYYDPTHNGEGIIVEVINETTAVVIWFTYDSDGNQYWILGTGSIAGNTITVDDAFSQFGPEYGPGYDPADATRVVWGDFSVTFSEDCSEADFSYESVLDNFGSGTQDMDRLTRVAGVDCGP